MNVDRELYVKEFSNVIVRTHAIALHYTYTKKFSFARGEVTRKRGLLLDQPTLILPLLDEAIVLAQHEILSRAVKQFPDSIQIPNPDIPLIFKQNVHARITNIPMSAQCVKETISDIRCRDILKLIKISGTIIRTGGVKVLESEREYECLKCECRFIVRSELENNNIIEIPRACKNSSGKRKCKSTNFKLLSVLKMEAYDVRMACCFSFDKYKGSEVHSDYQEVLKDELVDSCKAGDEVEVYGVVRRVWRSIRRDQMCDVELFIEANYCKVMNDSKASVNVDEASRVAFDKFWGEHCNIPLCGRNKLIRSVCPQLYGLFIAKMCVLLTLIGGVSRVENSDMKVRGESHLLIVGDPGTGKSQLLRYASKVTSRSVLTTGIGSTTAGLTVSAVKETGGEWVLEAGALVLADGGICCIDEFGSIREADRASIHEAMEQQTLSVAKAGLVCTLNTRTTVFAVTNPKGTYDPDADLSVNTSIASPLLSRFDIVLLLRDTKSAAWDERVSSSLRTVTKYILDSLAQPESDPDDGHPSQPISLTQSQSQTLSHPDSHTQRQSQPTSSQRNSKVNTNSDSNSNSNSGNACNSNSSKAESILPPKREADSGCFLQLEDEQGFKLDVMQQYIYYVKHSLHPHLTKWSERILIAYYQTQRGADSRNASRTTVRLLESLVRLAQAHARLMFRSLCIGMDAIMAVTLMEHSIQSASTVGSVHSFDLENEHQPDSQYLKHERIILRELNFKEEQLPDEEHSWNYPPSPSTHTLSQSHSHSHSQSHTTSTQQPRNTQSAQSNTPSSRLELEFKPSHLVPSFTHSQPIVPPIHSQPASASVPMSCPASQPLPTYHALINRQYKPLLPAHHADLPSLGNSASSPIILSPSHSPSPSPSVVPLSLHPLAVAGEDNPHPPGVPLLLHGQPNSPTCSHVPAPAHSPPSLSTSNLPSPLPSSSIMPIRVPPPSLLPADADDAFELPSSPPPPPISRLDADILTVTFPSCPSVLSAGPRVKLEANPDAGQVHSQPFLESPLPVSMTGVSVEQMCEGADLLEMDVEMEMGTQSNASSSCGDKRKLPSHDPDIMNKKQKA